MIQRYLKINLPESQSAFLWGARKTGKSTYLRTQFPESIYYDFLLSEVFLELSTHPERFRQQILAQLDKAKAHPVIIDEVQKIPAILNEVHWLIENHGLGFILCGSSARKLRRGHANLLGGRAWRYLMLPLVYPELDKPNLLTILNRGLLPAHYLSEQYRKSLMAYVNDYLIEEVFSTGVVRNLPAFSRFFETLGFCNGEMINYSKIASDTGVSSKTIKEYFQILVDTLLGYYVLPFNKRAGRDIISRTPKFYLFDTGVAGILSGRELKEEKGEAIGKALEHYIFMELKAWLSYHDSLSSIQYWRSKSGLEVDFVLQNGNLAIEVKSSSNVHSKDLRGIKTFRELYAPQKCIVITNEHSPRISDGLELLPWRDFLERLWNNGIVLPQNLA